MKPLGDNQAYVLQSLKERGPWSYCCGWLWDTQTGTIRIMESLVRRGLVVKVEIPATKMRRAHAEYHLDHAASLRRK